MRSRLGWFYGQIFEGKDRHHLTSRRAVIEYLQEQEAAVAKGNLGLPHR